MFLSTIELAKKYHVSHVTAWRWCKQGSIPAMKVGSTWIVDTNQLAGFDPRDIKEKKRIRNKVIAQARSNGTSLAFLAGVYGLSKPRICYIAKHFEEA